MKKDKMLFIASKYNAKGYSIEEMMNGDDCYHLTGESGSLIKDQIAEYMEELSEIGRKQFYEKYKSYKLY